MNIIKDRIEFIEKYVAAENAASGSEVDANANVTHKTLATLEAELYKPLTIQINRAIVFKKIAEMYGVLVAEQYLKDIEEHRIYIHDETSMKPYCASITLYPFLLEGTKGLDGVSNAPKNLQSFCGSFVNLVYQVATNFAGAIATVEFLHMFDYFARKQYGDNYLKTNKKEIEQELQGVVYSLNQPASARGDQCVFWNISVFDRPYMKEMFGSFYYPDGTQPDFESVRHLQSFFMEWFRKERTKELLTFPVVTASILTKKDGFADKEFADFCAIQMSKGHSFFVYMSDSVDSLASCCRLRNELADNTFSYSLGAGGVVTGSSQVITLNMNRIIQEADRIGWNALDYTRYNIDYVHKYLMAHKAVYMDYINAGMLPAYSAGFMDIDKQFLTLGVNGLAEGLESMGFTVSENDEYKQQVNNFLKTFYQMNKTALQKYKCRFNTELVPAENLGVKNAKWDKKDGLKVNRDCYNSYFYLVEDEDITILEKIQMYGEITDSLDGGSALHLNLQQLLTEENAKRLFDICRINGVPYWTINAKSTICEDCGYISPKTLMSCPKCGSKNISWATRIIGYLKKITNFSVERQKEEAKRFYH